MKNAAQIIHSLQTKPQFSKLSKYSCIDKIKSIFTPTLQKMIKFGYFKGNTLFFVLNHPGAKQEFDNNIENIKSALNFHMPKECEESNFEDIKAFVTHTPLKKTAPKKTTKLIYKERAKGDFDINIKDKKLNTLIKSIQKIIKAKHDT
jgi:hypothetical protein